MALRPNKIKYSTTDEGKSIKVDNFSVGTRADRVYGPTSTTNYYMGISPPISGYTIYKRKDAQGPSIFTPQNDSDLVFFANWLGVGPGGATNATEALYLLDQQTDVFVANRDYPNVVLSGLSYLYDAGYTGSYPRSGTTWRDLSFSAANATLINSPQFLLSGDGYFNFSSASTNYCTAEIANVFSQWTIDAWVLFKNLPPSPSNYHPAIITTNYTTNVNFGLFFGGFLPGGDNTKIVCGFFSNSSTGDFGGWFGTSGFTPTINTWYHISGTYDVSTLKLYRDGSLFATRSNTTATTSNNGTLYLMRRWDLQGDSPTPNVVDGYLMSAKVYKRALSSTEIIQNYNANGTPMDIVSDNLLVQLDGGNILSYPRLNGDIWTSMVYSTSNDATLLNRPEFNYGNEGNIKFDGTNDYASLPVNFFNPTSDGPFSINIWFKTSTNGGTIFCQKSSSDPSTATSSIPAIYIDNSGFLAASCFSGDSIAVQTSSSSVADGLWHNVVVTWYSNVQKLYIDNVYLGTFSQAQTNYSANYYYFLGAGYSVGWPNSNGTYFNGNIGYMSFYNSELTAAQVSVNYNAIKNRYK